MLIEPEEIECSIVLIGTFNPAIFNPTWFFQNGVEEQVEGDEASVDIIHRDVARFAIAGRPYQVEKERFQVSTSAAPFVAISDVVSLIFGELLTHTPIRAFGINLHVHYSVNDFEARNRVGRALAPIEPWGKFGTEFESNEEAGRVTGGLQSLTMRRIMNFETYSLNTNITVQPSARIPAERGIFAQVNHHHNLSSLPNSHGAGQAIELIGRNFDTQIEEANQIINHVMEI